MGALTETIVLSAEHGSATPAGRGPDVVYWKLFFQLCRGFLGQSTACCLHNQGLSDHSSFHSSKAKARRKTPARRLTAGWVLHWEPVLLSTA